MPQENVLAKGPPCWSSLDIGVSETNARLGKAGAIHPKSQVLDPSFCGRKMMRDMHRYARYPDARSFALMAAMCPHKMRSATSSDVWWLWRRIFPVGQSPVREALRRYVSGNSPGAFWTASAVFTARARNASTPAKSHFLWFKNGIGANCAAPRCQQKDHRANLLSIDDPAG